MTLPKSASVVIIGAGINGTGTAYYLAKEGIKDIVVLEKEYICSGATGRCGAGIRQQWSTEENTLLSMDAVKIYEGLSDELNWDIEYEQCGYLIPAYTEEYAVQFKKNVEMQKKLGLEVYYFTPKEAKGIVKDLCIDDMLCATYCPSDGGGNPHTTTFAYAARAREKGVNIQTYTEVIDIVTENGKIKKVITNKGEIETEKVVNTAGGYSYLIADMVGLKIPITPYRHQILVTEPVNHFFDPMVISFDYNIYFRQMKHGAILMGCGDKNEKPGLDIEADFEFMKDITKRAIKLMPKLKKLNIVRHWAGLYDMTPDAMPVLGDVPGIEGYYQAVGFSGHGYMLGPKVSTLMADFIAHGRKDPLLDKLSLERYNRGDIVIDSSVV